MKELEYDLEFKKATTATEEDKYTLFITDNAEIAMWFIIDKVEYQLYRQLESDRDEYKLKEQIAYTAKGIAEEAYQKAAKELQTLKEYADLIDNKLKKLLEPKE